MTFYLSDRQASVRNVGTATIYLLLLRVLIDSILKQMKSVCLTFIDYSAAFDSMIDS